MEIPDNYTEAETGYWEYDSHSMVQAYKILFKLGRLDPETGWMVSAGEGPPEGFQIPELQVVVEEEENMGDLV